jgi:hypothetical protein
VEVSTQQDSQNLQRTFYHFFTLASLTVRFQTELAIDTNLKISDTRKIVSDIHRVMVEHQGSDGANLPVSKYQTLSVTDNR